MSEPTSLMPQFRRLSSTVDFFFPNDHGSLDGVEKLLVFLQ